MQKIYRRAHLNLGRPFERGVTLLEVLIVVAILAMVAGSVAVFALPKLREAEKSTAETGARTIRTAVHSWQATTGEISCPTVSQLVQEKQLDSASNTKDPWNADYQINCTEDDVIVSSAGPDKNMNTDDDIVVPKGMSVEEEY